MNNNNNNNSPWRGGAQTLTTGVWPQGHGAVIGYALSEGAKYPAGSVEQELPMNESPCAYLRSERGVTPSKLRFLMGQRSGAGRILKRVVAGEPIEPHWQPFLAGLQVHLLMVTRSTYGPYASLVAMRMRAIRRRALAAAVGVVLAALVAMAALVLV
ncbi:hypothetical protein BDV96DRAFT_604450 [Lophiotrema nucula]|uniref:Uncharacterized protein n=1 Tax=Lophiotrema nucula TaxID=690887 RepID=A0A6A5YSL4_9PLEO|nr:hypothetical protein BDV96DRAFT_604450 [Lophiotrema nucula]